MLRDTPHREEEPLIYHIDVASMYPNIILTNRLQPCAIVTKPHCAASDHNKAGNGASARSTGRGAATSSRRRARSTTCSAPRSSTRLTTAAPSTTWTSRAAEERDQARAEDYSQKVYKKTKVTEVRQKVSTVCQRENPSTSTPCATFATVGTSTSSRARRGRRRSPSSRRRATSWAWSTPDKAAYYDSMSNALKCILNSFYGYVMRRGARWYSMEMAAITTMTGPR